MEKSPNVLGRGLEILPTESRGFSFIECVPHFLQKAPKCPRIYSVCGWAAAFCLACWFQARLLYFSPTRSVFHIVASEYFMFPMSRISWRSYYRARRELSTGFNSTKLKLITKEQILNICFSLWNKKSFAVRSSSALEISVFFLLQLVTSSKALSPPYDLPLDAVYDYIKWKIKGYH